MRTLLMTTALAALVAAPGYAASNTETTASAETAAVDMAAAEISADDLLDMTVYSSASVSADAEITEPGEDWEAIGEVGDVLISTDGMVGAVVLDIGGFLGIGERHVALSMDQITMVNDADADGAYFVVTNLSKEMLEEQPEFDEMAMGEWKSTVTPEEAMENAEAEVEEAAEAAETTAENAAAETEEAVETAAAETEQAIDNAAAETEQAVENAAAETEQAVENAAAETEETVETAAAETEEALDNAAAETEQAMANAAAETEQAVDTAAAETEEAVETAAAETEAAVQDNARMDAPVAPIIERDGFELAGAEVLTSEELTGAPLYDTSDELIGEVSKLILDDNGNITEAVLDVGGFLGLGEHSVALDIDSLNIQHSAESGEVRVYVDMTEDALKAMEEWSEG